MCGKPVNMCFHLKQSNKGLYSNFKALYGVVLGVLILLGVLIPLFVFGNGDFIIDDFESYNLGDLVGQGDWTGNAGYFNVTTALPFAGEKSIKSAWSIQGFKGVTKTPVEGKATGVISVAVYVENCYDAEHDTCVMLNLYGDGIPLGASVLTAQGGNPLSFGSTRYNEDFILVTPNITKLAWHLIQIDFNALAWTYRMKIDSNDWSDYIDLGHPEEKDFINEIDAFKVTAYWSKYYFDEIGGEYIPELGIEGLAPDSGTEITDFDDTLTIKYSNFDWDIYDGFIVNFKDDYLDFLANSVLFEADDLDASGTGEEIISLEDFGIDSNGKWNLTALGFGSELDIQGGLFLTSRGYINFWTGELVKEPYHLIINVEGLPEIYTFSDADEWYSANVERYASSTALFTSFVGLTSEMFQKVGEFANRSSNLFDKNESYERGYALGEIFPLINGYISKIDIFFGGFPLASTFKYLILLMFAGFIIKTVFKFIPLFG